MLVVVLSTLAACGRDKAPQVLSSAPLSVPVKTERARPSVTGEERDKLLSSATKGLLKSRDKMEKVSFYLAKNRSITRTNLDTYLAIPDGLPAILRVMPSYYGDDWIFFNTVKVMADDEIVYQKTFNHNDVLRDNANGSVWEIADYIAGDVELATIKKIIASKSATIRFSGNEHREDHEISRGERDRLQQILTAYEALSSLQ
jgi:hypothetical protein